MSDDTSKPTLPEGFADASIKPIDFKTAAELEAAGFTVVSVQEAMGPIVTTIGNGDKVWADNNASPYQTVSPISDNPMDQPPVVMEKVTPEEMLTFFRMTINKGYMPSATGEIEYNSKPEYTYEVNSWVKNKNTVSPGYGVQFFKEIDRWLGGTNPTDPIWAFIEIDNITVGCNLNTDELYVALVGSDWYPFTTPAPLNRLALANHSDYWLK